MLPLRPAPAFCTCSSPDSRCRPQGQDSLTCSCYLHLLLFGLLAGEQLGLGAHLEARKQGVLLGF